ncbi:hypothetical protein, partial [Paracoccus jeotgali]|uniref:hypothetical protein n=1 Tax=Paracoccus jeotgali TaxID=2065379 RepID=UPI0028AC5281
VAAGTASFKADFFSSLLDEPNSRERYALPETPAAQRKTRRLSRGIGSGFGLNRLARLDHSAAARAVSSHSST